jgi:hypothetical protein
MKTPMSNEDNGTKSNIKGETHLELWYMKHEMHALFPQILSLKFSSAQTTQLPERSHG